MSAHEIEDGVIIRAMLTHERATDLFLGDLTRRGYSGRTVDTYQRHLDDFGQLLRPDTDVTEITEDDIRRRLDRFNRRAPGTRAHAYSVLSSYFKWLSTTGRVKRNPIDRLERPRRVPAEDLDVVTVTPRDVRKLLDAAEGWTEQLTIGVLAYLGPRRRAVALLRLRDYDQVRGRLRFYEKGGKVIWKPVPARLDELIRAAVAAGTYSSPDDYLVPAQGPLAKTGDRDDRVIWRVVKDVAGKAGVETHVHALRAAFAVFYLEQHPGDVESLKDLLGHRSIATTQVYLRKRDKDAGMERVRTLDWEDNEEPSGIPQRADFWLESSPVVGAGGFEPPFADSSLDDSEPRQPTLDQALADQVRGPLRRADDEAEAVASGGRKDPVPRAPFPGSHEGANR